MMFIKQFNINIFFVFLFGLHSVFANSPQLVLSVAPNAHDETVLNFSHSDDLNFVRCANGALQPMESAHYPDNSPRPFIGADGHVWLLADNAQDFKQSTFPGNTHSAYVKILNSDLSAPMPGANQCQVAFTYTSVTPVSVESYSNLLSPVEFWSNGQTGNNFRLSVLIQSEFQSQDPKECLSGNSNECGYVNLIAGSWDNNRITMTQTANGQLQPSMVSPYQYSPGNGRQGVSGQTNIVQNPQDGYYYMLVNDQTEASINPMAQPGMCLFRTDNIADPTAWRGWDGTGFTVDWSASPYPNDVTTDSTPCMPVLPSDFRYALVYSPQYRTYIAVGVSDAQTIEQSAIVYTTTQDLTNWGYVPGAAFPEAVLQRYPNFVWMDFWAKTQPNTPSEPNNSFDAQGYLSVVDPTSNQLSLEYFDKMDSNFQYVGNTPYLYFVYFHAKQTGVGGSSMQDIDRLQLQLQCTANCSSH